MHGHEQTILLTFDLFYSWLLLLFGYFYYKLLFWVSPPSVTFDVQYSYFILVTGAKLVRVFDQAFSSKWCT